MKAIKFLLTLVTLVMAFSTCSENDNVEPNPIPTETDEPLTDEELAFLETVKDTVFRLEDILLDDGQDVRSFLESYDPGFLQDYPSGKVGETKASTPREQKKAFLSEMLGSGNSLVDRTQHVYPAQGDDKPFQFGLAYSWGSKEYNVRKVPDVAVANGCNNLKIHGLDCSGMIWAMTQAARLPPVEPRANFTVKAISDAEKWTKAFKASADYKDLKMKDMGKLEQNKMKNGDLILWRTHVGIYLNGWFYQSNGGSEQPRCESNLKVSSGPRLISLRDVLLYGLGNYKIFRIIVDTEFKFEMRFATDNRLTGGLVSKAFQEWDSTSMKIEIKDGVVTCSDIFNIPGKVTPGSITDVLGCTSTQIPPDGFKGAIDVSSATGQFAEDKHMLSITMVGTAQAPAFQWKCAEATQLFPSLSSPLLLPIAVELNVNDGITTYADPSKTFFARLTPKD